MGAAAPNIARRLSFTCFWEYYTIMAKKVDIWYAVQSTRVILPPRQTLETFGSTTIHYHLVSELMDDVNKVRVRKGRIYSERPQIITPASFGASLLEGFGEKAREYADYLSSHGEIIRILKYGLHFRKDSASEELINDTIEAVTEKVKQQVERRDDALATVLVGADELWEVSLLKFLVDYIQNSAPTNYRELARSGEADADSGAAQRLHEGIESDFAEAARDPRQIDALGNKLQRTGMFEQYEDRFYGLVRRHR